MDVHRENIEVTKTARKIIGGAIALFMVAEMSLLLLREKGFITYRGFALLSAVAMIIIGYLIYRNISSKSVSTEKNDADNNHRLVKVRRYYWALILFFSANLIAIFWNFTSTTLATTQIPIVLNCGFILLLTWGLRRTYKSR